MHLETSLHKERFCYMSPNLICSVKHFPLSDLNISSKLLALSSLPPQPGVFHMCLQETPASCPVLLSGITNTLDYQAYIIPK